MEEADLGRLSKFTHVIEVWEIVGEWKFYIEGCDKPLKIKVEKGSDGRCQGIANYEIWGPKQAGPYISIRPCVSVQEAIEDSLRGFLAYWNPEKADKIKLVPYEDY